MPETIVQTTAILFLLSLYARNRIVRNVTVSAASREIQIPFNPNNFASITAQITMVNGENVARGHCNLVVDGRPYLG